MRFLLNKLRRRRIWERLLVERLNEPLHINFLSLFVALFGSYRRKIDFDLIVRPQHAYGLLEAALEARVGGLKKITAIEVGVASGAGLVNMATIAPRIHQAVGVEIEIIGFDTGTGMPAPRDYRDHPERYWEGNYPLDEKALTKVLPANTRLVLGDLTETIPRFLGELKSDSPLGFVSLDVDYYWSTVEALKLFSGDPSFYLPATQVYVDDINLGSHNSWCGALLAIREFNEAHASRKIERDEMLPTRRIFRNARWIAHMYKLHVLDHPVRNDLSRRPHMLKIDNPYV